MAREYLKLSLSDIPSLGEEEETEADLTPEPSYVYFVPSICSYRRALDSDIQGIETLVTETTSAVFGYESVAYKIKKCYFSMVAVNADNRIIAAICLDDHPNIPALPKSEWETWIKKLYNLCNLTSQNTLWIHLLLCHPSYTYTFAKPLLENVYLNFPYLVHLVCVVPGDAPCFCFLEENFTCVMPVGYTNPKKVQTLYLTLRHHYIVKYKIRLAVEEDNDDIVSIIHSQTTKLKQLYGDYYLSEILTKFPSMNRKIIVAEIAERAVGVLFLNGDVNYKSLIGSFNLEPFANLHDLRDEAIIKHRSYIQSISNIEPDLDGTSMKDPTKESSISTYRMTNDELDFDIEDVISMSEIFDLEKLGITILADDSLAVQENNNETMTTYPSSESTDKNTENFHLQEPPSDIELPTPSCSMIQFQLPYHCESAFSLEIMAAGEEHEQGVICDLLEAAFQGFVKKNKSFCVFSVLHSQTHFPLFDFFVRAIPRRITLYPHEVYVLHKNAIKANLEVRKLSKREYSKVKALISNISNVATLLDAVTKSLYGAKTKLKTYIMANSSVIIGVMIVKVETHPEYYFDHYKCCKYVDLTVHRYDKCGLIEFCIISPVFHKHTQYFLKEVHRLTDMAILFFKLPRCELFQKTRSKPLAGILKDMIPVLDRVQPNFSHITLDEIEVPSCMQERKKDLFSLFMSTRRLCSLPRIEVNSRIVVVGSSCTGLSFLESLIFHFDGTRHVNFNNLSLIYDRTLRDSSNVSRYIPHMFLYRGKFTGNHLNSMCFHTHVNYVNGFMTAIDRKFKYITINKETIVPYDYLFLMCGQQYNHPYATGVRKDKLTETCPENVFVINKYSDAENSFQKIHSFLKTRRNPTIIVYGSCLNTYGCLTALEKTRFPNFNIKFVEPVPDEYERPSMDPFNNPEIYDAFHDILYLIGIEVYTGYYFFEWELNQTYNIVTNVKYQSRKGAVSFNCDFIFHYANKEVNFDTFSAINNAGLVYDGKLVIGPECRTNDPYIFAAGPMTKYSRRYFADRYLHRYYNSHEIGERLGRQIRSMLLPGGKSANEGDNIFDILHQEETNKLVPQYKDPLLVNCILPGGINYLDIHGPGKPIPLETQRNIGNVFETGNLKKIELDEDPEYFRLQLDKHFKVEQIVCFTRKEIDVSNFQRLWGQHEQTLNNLVIRFKKGMILNFYDYFRNPYFCAIYIDRFHILQSRLEAIMTLLTSVKGKSIIEDVVHKLIKNNWKRLSLAQELHIQFKFTNSSYHKQMVEEVMEYLGQYCDYLPMYAHPLITKIILYDVEMSPLFQIPPDENGSSTSQVTQITQ